MKFPICFLSKASIAVILCMPFLRLHASDRISFPEPPEGMAFIPGGSFQMGGDEGLMGGNSQSHRTAYPVHEVELSPFWIDETEVTNEQFARFVEETGYVTFAERPLSDEVMANLKEEAGRQIQYLENLYQQSTDAERKVIKKEIQKIREASTFGDQAGSIIFREPKEQVQNMNDYTQWWQIVHGATWRNPEGGETSWKDLLDHPVVNVTYEDASAYAEWAGKRLPTEAEWERAARGGLEQKPYVWGEEKHPHGPDKWMANIWQGEFPYENSSVDGHATTSPVRSFPPNGYGLYDMAGNVWEIVSDHYFPHTYRMRENGVFNPLGPKYDWLQERGLPTTIRVTKGGSFLCSAVYCSGYKPGSRQSVSDDSPASHTGFRCAMDIPVAQEPETTSESQGT